MKSNKAVLNVFKKAMVKVAKEHKTHPAYVTKAKYTTSEVEKPTEWEVRKLGGFDALKKLVFEAPEDLAFDSGASMVKSHKNKLNEKYGKRLFTLEEMSNRLQHVLENNPIKLHKATTSLKKNKKSKSRTIVAHLSDTHYGCNIDRDEVNVNEFNWTIASRRTALFMEQIVNYKPHYRDETDLVFCINGDIIAGVIHDQEWFADLLTLQYAGTIHILAQAIGYAAQHFSKIKVVCTPGNHGRAMHKKSKDRATTHKWDSYETIIFLGLKGIVESKYKNVSVEVPMSPFAIFDAQGHKFFQTHGDTVINVGNPGRSLNMRSINEQINKLNASEIGGDHKFSGVLVGHVHTPLQHFTESGCNLLINGCLSGVDPYALSIGVYTSNPTQQMFEVTKEHAVGDLRFIQIKEADPQSRLDKIIEPFKGVI